MSLWADSDSFVVVVNSFKSWEDLLQQLPMLLDVWDDGVRAVFHF